MYKFDRERWHWFGGITTVEYLQNLWCYAEYPDKFPNYIYCNFWWLCVNWPSFFPDIEEI